MLLKHDGHTAFRQSFSLAFRETHFELPLPERCKRAVITPCKPFIFAVGGSAANFLDKRFKQVLAKLPIAQSALAIYVT